MSASACVSDPNPCIGEIKVLENIGEMNLTIPLYQRAYCWTEHEVGQLLGDLKDSFEKNLDHPYLLGTLIVHCNESNHCNEIVDGQQRLTTLTLLLLLLKNPETEVLLKEIPTHTTSKQHLRQNVAYIERRPFAQQVCFNRYRWCDSAIRLRCI